MISRLRSVAVACLVWTGCGGGSGVATEHPETSTGGERPPPVVPEDPLALVSADAVVLSVIDLSALRGSPHFDALRRLAERATCRPLDPTPPVLERTDRLVVAAFPAPRSTAAWDVLMLAQGHYQPDDASEMVAVLGEAFGGAGDVIDADARGRFTIVSDGVRMATVLGPRLLAAGDATQVERVLARVEGERDSGVRESAMFGALDVSAWLSDQAMTIVSAGSVQGARVRLRGLAQPLARGLERRPNAWALSLEDGVELRMLGSLEDPAHAQALVADARGTLDRADLVLRLMGLPAIASRVQVETRGPLARLALHLTDTEVAQLLAALDRAVDALPPAECPAGTTT